MGISVNTSKCTVCGHCIDICPFGAISLVDGTITISEECRMCLLCVRECPVNALSAEKGKGQSQGTARTKSERERILAEHKGVMVFAEYHDTGFSPVTFELIGKARELAGKIDQTVSAVVVGDQVSEAAAELLSFGVDKVLVYDDPALKHFVAATYTGVLEDAVNLEKPGIVLIGATNLGRSLAPRLAARLRTGLTADCTILDVRPNGDLVQTRPAFGGNIMATILTPAHRPQMATVRYKVMASAERVEDPKGIMSRVDLPEVLRSLAGIQTIDESGVPQAESLAAAKVIVAVGRGLRSESDIPMFEAFARSIGGVLACTRPLVEKGWFPSTRQIGLSGRTIRPEIYVGCGISGAVQHTAGMDNSKLIFAINSDKDAPIFHVAHYCLVADMYELVPEILKSFGQGGDK